MIKEIKGYEVLDSRGNPTVMCKLRTDKGDFKGLAPSGASTGKHEAIEKRDHEARYRGKGVRQAVKALEQLGQHLIDKDEREWKLLEKEIISLDDEQKRKFGGNTFCSLSIALVKAASAAEGKEVHQYFGGSLLPTPMLNILNGGKHAGNNLAVQEFLIIPKAECFSECMEHAHAVYYQLKDVLKEKYGKSAINVGDEGGFAPPLAQTSEALELLVKSIEEVGLKGKVLLALDAAASSFYHESKQTYAIDGKTLSAGELLDYYNDLIKTYPIISLEDPFYEEDFSSFAEITKKAGIQIVGDDLITTNPHRIRRAIEEKSINAALIKINQIGTVSETLQAIALARKGGMRIIISHRSGDTCDAFISDFAVGMESEGIKTGAPCRGERTAKYNRLLEIEADYGLKLNTAMVS